ncbi:MAG: hypothetical protein AcusKO_43570 [Acuticoccus sp.]
MCGTSRPRTHAAHARHPLGSGGIDAADLCVVVRRARAADVAQAVEQVVVVEGRAARHVAQHVLALRRLADLVEIVVALVGEEVLAEFDGHRRYPVRRTPPRSDAARMALMMAS